MKRILAGCLVLFFFFAVLPCVRANGISAQSFCVMDGCTGRVLYEGNSRERRGMASTTKIMTALVALENGNLDDVATVSYKASRTEGSSLYLKQGEKMTVEDLVYGLMLQSGNDAAVVLAEHIAGSVEEFAALMNEKAQEIGALDTAFQNPNGLDADGHYTTAYDLALITRRALKNETFANIVSTKSHKIKVIGGDGRTIYLTNHNKLLNSLEGCDGVKTGFTKKIGRCLVSSASRDGWQAICVTLNAPNDWKDHTALIEQAFSEYRPQKVLSQRQFVKTVQVEKGEEDTVRLLAKEDFYLPGKAGEVFDLELDYQVSEKLTAPVGFEQEAGSVQIKYKGELLGSVALISEKGVYQREDPTYMDFLKNILKNWLQVYTG